MRHAHFFYALALCTMAIPFTVNAQLSWSGGFLLGPNVSNERIQENDILDSEIKAGYSLGLSVACHTGKRLVVRAEALLEQKGSRFKTTFVNDEGISLSEGYVRKQFHYLVLPLTVQYRFGAGNFRYGPYAGAYWAKLLSQKLVAPEDLNQLDQDQTDSFKQSDAGAIAGFGLEWAIEEGLFFSLDARYSMGLTNYFLDNSIFDGTHQSLALLAGFRFAFGK